MTPQRLASLIRKHSTDKTFPEALRRVLCLSELTEPLPDGDAQYVENLRKMLVHPNPLCDLCGNPCNYVADYAAPGSGQAWACTACNAPHKKMGTSFWGL